MEPIIFFDGVCNLCHASVRWIIRRDPKAIFHFASLQSEVAARVLNRPGSKTVAAIQPTAKASRGNNGGSTDVAPTSVLLAADNQIWEKSDAWIQILKRLGGFWAFAGGFCGIFPRGLRDTVYDWIATQRYRWFGKKNSCPLPAPDLKDRFLN